MQQCDKFTVLTSVVVVNPSICLPLLKMCPVTVNRITAVIANRPAPAKKKKKRIYSTQIQTRSHDFIEMVQKEREAPYLASTKDVCVISTGLVLLAQL